MCSDETQSWRYRVYGDIDLGIVNARADVYGDDGIRLAESTESAERSLMRSAEEVGLTFEKLVAKFPFPLWEVRAAIRANFRAGLADQIRYGARGENPNVVARRCLYWARRAGIDLKMSHEELAKSLEQPNWPFFHQIDLGECDMPDEEILAEQIQICDKRPPNAPPCYEDAGTGRYHFCRFGDVGDSQRAATCMVRLQALHKEGEGIRCFLTIR